MRQYGITAKSFEQQCSQVRKALRAHRLLSGILSVNAKELERTLFFLSKAMPSSVEESTPKGAAFYNLLCSVQWDGCRGDHRTMLCDLRLLDEYTPHDGFCMDSLACTLDMDLFTATLAHCARVVLRSPDLTPGSRLRAEWTSVAQNAENYRIVATLVRDEEIEMWERLDAWDAWDGRLEEDEEDEEDEEGEEGGEGGEGLLAVLAVPATRATLQAFVADPQNVHTAAARSGTERAIEVLMPSSPIENLLDEWTLRQECTGNSRQRKAIEFFLESVAHDSAIDVRVPYVVSSLVPLQFVTVGVSYGILANAAARLYQKMKRLGDERAELLLNAIMATVWSGYCDTEAHRRVDMARLLCAWTPEIGETAFPLESWTAHNHSNCIRGLEKLLCDIHEAWAEALTAPPPAAAAANDASYPAWSDVLESEAWDEFKHDVETVRNFGISYFSLLNSIWDYTKTQAADIGREILVRLAEEILDGIGMCEQGKMTRLANVLRGFHSALEDVSVLSVGEQLQNRMTVVSTLPLEERRAAAADVFAEFGVSAEDQVAWLEAALEA
jgi:hypothetical protein